MAIITLTLSEAQWELYPDQAEDNCTHKIEIPLPAGPWISVRYEDFTNQDGDERGLPVFHEGWRLNIDNDLRVWTDLTIEIEQDPDYADWKYEAINGDTLLGFREWKLHQVEAKL